MVITKYINEFGEQYNNNGKIVKLDMDNCTHHLQTDIRQSTQEHQTLPKKTYAAAASTNIPNTHKNTPTQTNTTKTVSMLDGFIH